MVREGGGRQTGSPPLPLPPPPLRPALHQLALVFAGSARRRNKTRTDVFSQEGGSGRSLARRSAVSLEKKNKNPKKQTSHCPKRTCVRTRKTQIVTEQRLLLPNLAPPQKKISDSCISQEQIFFFFAAVTFFLCLTSGFHFLPEIMSLVTLFFFSDSFSECLISACLRGLCWGFLVRVTESTLSRRRCSSSQSGVCVFSGWRSGPTVAGVQN